MSQAVTDAPDRTPTPDEADAEPAQHDAMLRVAVVGSLVLAVPGAVGAIAIAPLVPVVLTYGNHWAYPVYLLVLILVPVVGFYLLVGYRRELRHGGSVPRWFWGLSAGYNGVGAALAATNAGGLMQKLFGTAGPSPSGYVPVYPTLAAVVLVWTVGMTVLSVSRARRPPADPDRPSLRIL